MRQYRFLIIIFVLIIIGFLLDPFGFLKPVRGFAYSALSPFTSTISRATQNTGNFFSTLISLNKLASKNEQLTNDNLQLKATNIQLNDIKHENDLLRSQLQFMKSSSFQLIPAKIIAKSPTGFLDTIVIDKGSSDGVKTSQAVISNGFLVGVIKQAYSHNSSVQMITSNSSKIPAILEESRGTGLVQGGLTGLHIVDVQLETNIKQGEAVLTSDLGQIITAGIPIGQVTQTTSPESDISQSAEITSPISFGKLETVFIVK